MSEIHKKGFAETWVAGTAFFVVGATLVFIACLPLDEDESPEDQYMRMNDELTSSSSDDDEEGFATVRKKQIPKDKEKRRKLSQV